MKNRVGFPPVLHRNRVGAAVCAVSLGLAACAVAPGGQGYRDQGAAIGVTSRYSDARFGGTWHVRGAYPPDADVTTIERLADGSGGAAWVLTRRDCGAEGICEDVATIWPAATDVPGADRLSNPSDGAARRAVVLWVDESFRTAAVGDPSGRFAWILDRARSGGADRIKAARSLLEFSGFDLAEMQMRP